MDSLFRKGYRINDGRQPHFLTSTIIDWVDLFTRPELAQIVTDSLTYCSTHKELAIYGWCLLPNHLHLLVSQAQNKLTDTMRDFKRHTAQQILKAIQTDPALESRRDWIMHRFRFAGGGVGQAHKVWQDGYHPIDCYDRNRFERCLVYIHENPVKAGLVWRPEDYRYSSAVDFCGRRGLVPVCVD